MTKTSHKNRGMELEKKIDIANKMYSNGHGLQRNYVASIHKIPTNIQITKELPGKVMGFKKKGELVDYVGTLLGGHAIAFDAKQTKGKSLPLSNIHDHQYEFLKTWYNLGATTFLIVYFSEQDKYYRLPFKDLRKAWERKDLPRKEGGRKSIALEEFEIELIYHNGILNYLEGL